jgi:DNA-binding CsgD family transcriptional regulator
VTATAETSQLLLALIVEATPAERDLLLLLMAGADRVEASERLHLTRSAFDVRLHRIRRRAECVRRRAKVRS